MKAIRKITSRDNAKLKFVRKVRDGKTSGAIFIEGLRLAEESLRARLKISEVYLSENFGKNERENELIEAVTQLSADVSEVADKIFPTIADTNQSQGIILLAEKPNDSKREIEKNLLPGASKLPLVIFLHEINNPSNLGAILRTAEAVGAAGIIVSDNSADVFSAKAIRAAMGANLRLPIWENARFVEVVEWAKARNLIATAADINAEKSYLETDWTKQRLLIFGSEAHGLSAEQREQTDDLTYIPMENAVESLNIAVSCGIILFEAKRRFEK